MKQCKITINCHKNKMMMKTRIVCECGQIIKDSRPALDAELYLPCKRCGSKYCVVVPSIVIKGAV